MRNVGLEPLEIDDIFITPQNQIFGFDYDWEAIPPDSSAVIWIFFSPDEEDSYEARLTIESNDRDEGVLEVPLTGNALSVGMLPESLPIEFAIRSAYPNPFNSVIQLRYGLSMAGKVKSEGLRFERSRGCNTD